MNIVFFCIVPDLGPNLECLHETRDHLVKPKPKLLLKSLRRIFVLSPVTLFSEIAPGFFHNIFLSFIVTRS